MPRKLDVSIGSPLKIVAGSKHEFEATVVFAHPAGRAIAIRLRASESPGVADLTIWWRDRPVPAGPPRGSIRIDQHWEFSLLLPADTVDLNTLGY
jgi:hypothetical protein